MLVNLAQNYSRLAVNVSMRMLLDAKRYCYIVFVFNLRLFAITETELKLIASAASIGLNSIPTKGYKTPAAIGIPMAL